MSDRRALTVVFAVAIAVCAVFTKSHVLSWNDGSRFATIDSLVSDRTFAIDRSPYAKGLGDEIRFGGRTYSDKPPLLAVIGAGYALALAPLGITLRQTPGTAVYLITLLTVGVWFAVGCAYAYAFQRMLGYRPAIAVAVAGLTGVATLALPYAIVLTNHVPCGAAALAGCYHLCRARNGAALHAIVGGAFFALAYAFDAAGLIMAVAAAVLLWEQPVRRWLWACAAALPFVAGQLGYNLAISGSIIPTVFNAAVWNDPNLPLHEWSSQMSHVYAPAEYAGFAVNLLVGSRGLFSYTPLAAVAAYGFVQMSREAGLRKRIALAVGVTFTLFFLAIVFLQNDVAARNFGERRYVDLFFVLGIGIGPALVATRGWGRAAIRVAAAASTAFALLGTVAPFAGAAGESGFAFGTAEFAALARRAPVQAALDIMLLCLLVVAVEGLIPRSQDTARKGLTSDPTTDSA